jgi:hypothetical protein
MMALRFQKLPLPSVPGAEQWAPVRLASHWRPASFRAAAVQSSVQRGSVATATEQGSQSALNKQALHASALAGTGAAASANATAAAAAAVASLHESIVWMLKRAFVFAAGVGIALLTVASPGPALAYTESPTGTQAASFDWLRNKSSNNGAPPSMQTSPSLEDGTLANKQPLPSMGDLSPEELATGRKKQRKKGKKRENNCGPLVHVFISGHSCCP